MREIGKEPQLAGLKRCRETFHEETPSVTNDLEIAATCEDTPIRRRGANQQRNLRNESRLVPQ
jgi:hypothetical protein